MLAGTLLFVLGFTAVFVSLGALFGGLGSWLIEHTVTIQRVLGIITILMGLAFMGLLPGSAREWRIHRAPTIGPDRCADARHPVRPRAGRRASDRRWPPCRPSR